MPPTVFLSHSSVDHAFVQSVFDNLPVGIATIFTKSFRNGHELLSEMEKFVKKSAIFVLFASNSSIASAWVNFELNQAHLQSLTREGFQILVFPTSHDFKHENLPAWMRHFTVDTRPRRPKDVARYITSILLSAPFRTDPGVMTPRGRGQLLDQFDSKFALQLREIGQSPNVLIFSGLPRIGRRTFAKLAFDRAYPSLPRLAFGPTIELNLWSDSEDLFLRLRGTIDEDSSVARRASLFSHFCALSNEEQISEIIKSLTHFSSLGEASLLLFPTNLYDDTGRLRAWISNLFLSLHQKKEVIIGIVSDRAVAEADLLKHQNVLQIRIPPLKDDAIETIFINTCAALGTIPKRVHPTLLKIIGGHPDLARAAARLASQMGQEVIASDPAALFDFQEGILKNNIQDKSLSATQKAILIILSWVPSLPSATLLSIIKEDGVDELAFSDAVRGLIIGCLVEYIDNDVVISSAVRYYVRRRFGYGDSIYLRRLSKYLEHAVRNSSSSKGLSNSLVDAAIFAICLEGRAVPKELKRIITPAILQRIIADAYRAGRDDEEMYRKVIKWGEYADNIEMPNDTRWQILSTVCQAHIRLREFASARDKLAILDNGKAPERFFIAGFLERQCGRPKEAIKHFQKAIDGRVYRRSSVHQLGLCYLREGQFDSLKKLLDKKSSDAAGSEILLDIKAQFEIVEGHYSEAQATIAALRQLPDDAGRSHRCEAWLFYKRGDANTAIRILTQIVKNSSRREVESRYYRAIIAVDANRPEIFQEDYEYILNHGRYKKDDMLRRLRMRKALTEGDWRSAEQEIEGVDNKNFSDMGLYKKMLELKARDGSIDFTEAQTADRLAKDIMINQYKRDLFIDEEFLG